MAKARRVPKKKEIVGPTLTHSRCCLGTDKTNFFRNFSCELQKVFGIFARHKTSRRRGQPRSALSQPIVDRKLSAPVVASSRRYREQSQSEVLENCKRMNFSFTLFLLRQRERDPKIVTFEEFKTISPPPRRRRCCLALKIYDKLQKVERSRFSSFYSLTTFARNLSRRIYKISNVSSSAASAAASWKNYQQCGRSRGELCCCTANIAFNACLN